jgi:hypothetical protein
MKYDNSLYVRGITEEKHRFFSPCNGVHAQEYWTVPSHKKWLIKPLSWIYIKNFLLFLQNGMPCIVKMFQGREEKYMK